MKDLLQKLANAHGISGFEGDIREIMANELKGYVDQIEVDNLRNLIITKKGKPDSKKVMLAAHMDEIGLMIKYIDKKGFIKFSTIGGISDQTLLNHDVLIHSDKGEILGVIGSKPPHLMKPEDRKKVIKHQDMVIDIGVETREEAEKLVGIGDPITIKQEFNQLENSMVTGKALDNRVGCAIIIEVLKRVQTDANVYGVGTVQEEVGLKGARTSAFKINPDMAIALDVAVAGDHPGIKEGEAPTCAGKGPVVVLTDASGRGIITHPLVKELLISTAEEEGIPYQLDVSEGGTTDASAIHLTREGIPAGVLSPAVRYMHSPVEVVNME
ncbi:MAG: M42 family metallopeptidase, partial [Methanobacterium sp.]